MENPESPAVTPMPINSSPTKPVEELSYEAREEQRNLRAAALASQVLAGALTVLPIEAVVAEDTEFQRKVSMNMRVPTIADEDFIETLAVSYYPAVGRFDVLPAEARYFAKARATVEYLGEPPYERWVTTTDRVFKSGDKAVRKPDFAVAVAARRNIVAIYDEFRRVVTRFQ
jgi:hypothetical protein